MKIEDVPSTSNAYVDDICLICGSSAVSDKEGEEWSRCVNCGGWAHNLCSGIENEEWETFKCDFCANQQ